MSTVRYGTEVRRTRWIKYGTVVTFTKYCSSLVEIITDSVVSPGFFPVVFGGPLLLALLDLCFSDKCEFAEAVKKIIKY